MEERKYRGVSVGFAFSAGLLLGVSAMGHAENRITDKQIQEINAHIEDELAETIPDIDNLIVTEGGQVTFERQLEKETCQTRYELRETIPVIIGDITCSRTIETK